VESDRLRAAERPKLLSHAGCSWVVPPLNLHPGACSFFAASQMGGGGAQGALSSSPIQGRRLRARLRSRASIFADVPVLE